MGIAASRGSPRKKPLPILTPEYYPGLSIFTSRYFEGLYSRLRTPSLIVFDNYQEVPLGLPFHEVMRNGFETIPEGIKVIAISRREPPTEFARLRANNSLEVIGWDKLKLSMEESSGIMRLKLKKRGSKEFIREIYEKTDGWAAGLILMIGKDKHGWHEAKQLDITAVDAIHDYFQSEILGKLDNETRDFLLKTAILPFIDSHMAERLTGVSRSGQILSE